MYEGCFLQTRFSKIFNVSVDQKARPSICFKTRGGAFETLGGAFEGVKDKKKLAREFEKLGRVPTSHGNIQNKINELIHSYHFQ